MQSTVSEIKLGVLDDGFGSIRELRFEQYDLSRSFQHGQPMIRCGRGNPDITRQICFVQQVCRTKRTGTQKSLEVAKAANIG
jgi:hypothetical protein